MNENFEIGESSKNVGKNNVEDIGKLDNISNLVSKDNQNMNLNENPQKIIPLALLADEPEFRRKQPFSRANSLNQNGKPPNFVNRAISYQPSIATISQYGHSTHNDHDPPSSTAEEKWKMTRRYFATVFSISYALFLIVFGAIVFVGDVVRPNFTGAAAEIFALYMMGVGIIYFLLLMVDIRLHIYKAKSTIKERQRRIREFEEQMAQNNMQMENSGKVVEAINGSMAVEMPEVQIAPLKSVSHRYCFMTGRHGEFLYLKLGATWFCLGLLVHSALLLTYQGVFVATGCESGIRLAVEIVFPIYAIILLFFIFKYINVVINEFRGLARLFLMHAIGTALALWIYTIARETADAIRMKEKKYISRYDAITMQFQPYLTGACPEGESLNVIYRQFAPYLYPFIIEFNILIVGIFYMIFANINQCPKKLSAKGHSGHHNPNQDNASKIESESSEHCDNIGEHETQFKSTLIVHADCHKANRGLFAGLVLMILTITFIILLHVAVQDESNIDVGILMDSIFELVVMALLILAVLIAYYETSQLDINPHPISKLDDVLLFVAVPAFFSETTFSLLPAVLNGSLLNIFNIFCQLIQIMIQTPWIIDALRRCANSADLRKRKPGRELVTFLTVANVSLWVYYTFSVRNVDLKDERYKFYGDVLWSILNHLSLPLIMFYRFHASVCLVDIWRHSYEVSAGH